MDQPSGLTNYLASRPTSLWAVILDYVEGNKQKQDGGGNWLPMLANNIAPENADRMLGR